MRTANALGTMSALERYEGHFYNWYDTQTGKPLPPLYVSAVDSGNLAGHLMTLRPGLAALADDRIVDVRWFEGLSDTARALAEAIGGNIPAPLSHLLRDLETAYDSRPTTIAAAREWLDRLGARRERSRREDRRAGREPARSRFVAGAPRAKPPSGRRRSSANAARCRRSSPISRRGARSPPVPDEIGALTGLRGIPTLRELAALRSAIAARHRAQPTRAESFRG